MQWREIVYKNRILKIREGSFNSREKEKASMGKTMESEMKNRTKYRKIRPVKLKFSKPRACVFFRSINLEDLA